MQAEQTAVSLPGERVAGTQTATGQTAAGHTLADPAGSSPEADTGAPGVGSPTPRLRARLGDFSSVVCLKAIIVGMEDILGVQATAISLTSAGRIRGKDVSGELGTSGAESLDQLARRLDEVLGAPGTRLCTVDRIERSGDSLLAYTSETVCSTGEEEGSDRKCTYTLGVVWGALEQVLDIKLRGSHVESVLRGASHDIFRFDPR